ATVMILCMVQRRPTSPHCPYTTLFRSRHRLDTGQLAAGVERPDTTRGARCTHHGPSARSGALPGTLGIVPGRFGLPRPPTEGPRSEEHTSELQSREKLGCRLLLEKKNE